jgi:hypothetical protein
VGVQSKLKLLSDPETYLQRVQVCFIKKNLAKFHLQRENELREQQKYSAQSRKHEEEVALCTFKPEIHDAPEYVKRIAKSVALLKKNSNKNKKGH